MSDEPAYRLRFSITADDTIDATRLLQVRLRRAYDVAAAFALVIGLAIAAFGDAWFGTIVAVWAALVLVMNHQRALARRVAARRDVPVKGGSTVELLVAPDGITYRSARTSGSVTWASMSDVRSDDRCVIFVSGRSLAAYAPRSAFASAAERDAILAFARERIAAAATR